MPRRHDIEELIKNLTGDIVEVVQPYNGRMGNQAAEIYSDSALYTMPYPTEYGSFCNPDLPEIACHSGKDVMVSNMGMRGGTKQILFKTEESFQNFCDNFAQLYKELYDKSWEIFD